MLCSRSLKNVLRTYWRCRSVDASQKIPEKMTLYGDDISPPVRLAMVTASFLNIDLYFQKIDLVKQDNKSDFYRKINPLQKVPALSVNNTVILEGSAIAMYLCELKNDHILYPKEPLLKAKVDQMMFFNASTLFPLDSAIFTSYFGGRRILDGGQLRKWYEYLDFLEIQLTKHEWLADDEMRLCDISCYTTVSSLELLISSLPRHVRLNLWLDKLKAHPNFAVNHEGIANLKALIATVDKGMSGPLKGH